MTLPSPSRMALEAKWLLDNPHFEERPANLREFLGPDYLNISERVRASITKELEMILGEDVRGDRITVYPFAMMTGGIGIGKTTIASIVLTYLAHWVLCLKDPQGFFNLLPGSRIAFMQMSTSEKQALEVVFGDVKARVLYSPWFQAKYQFDPSFKNQLRFPKDIWIIPGDSAETTFEGYNILGGILDEADSHKQTKDKDYAEQGYTTISSRITSRFGDRGFLMVIGQMKSATGFAAKKFAEYKKRADAYAVRMSIWESLGWQHFLKKDGKRDSFFYDTERHEIVPSGIMREMGPKLPSNIIEIPKVYEREFVNNPAKALRDLAGIPLPSGAPFIELVYKITEARSRWVRRHGVDSPVDVKGKIANWFQCQENLKRACHIDIAYSDEGDALGFAMGHVPEVVVIEGERKPYIVIDMLIRMVAPPGREIFLGDVRRMVYMLRDDRHFKIKAATMDGFQSTDTRQQFERRRIWTDIVSVDKTVLPYSDLRDALYEGRIEFPPYMVRLRPDDTELTEILVKELTELVDNGNKIDHPNDGSKDVADAVAGVCYTLMGDRSYHRKVVSMDSHREEKAATGTGPSRFPTHPVISSGHDLRAPVPPSDVGVWRPPK